MKETKAQPPSAEHKIQGVIIQCSEDHITVKPCPQRVQRILTELHNHLQTDSMTPEQARRLAGKCSFTTTHLFGRVGRAPLRALYDKSFSTSNTINTATRTAIIALTEILITLQAEDPTVITHTNSNDNHLHRRFLLRWSENMEK